MINLRASSAETFRAPSPSSVSLSSDDGDSRSGSKSPPSSTAAVAAAAVAQLSSGRKRRGGAQLTRIPLAASASSSQESVDSIASTTATNVNVATSATTTITSHEQKRQRLISTSSTNSASSLFPDGIDIVDLETTPSVKHYPLARGGTIIGDGDFELVGDGEECRAVHVHNQTIHHCQAMKGDTFGHFLAVADRLEEAKSRLSTEEHAELCRLLMPEETRVIAATAERGLFYVISPDHQGSLYTLSRVEHQSTAMSRSIESPWNEAQARRVFAQIVRLVTLCHRVGIYLRDFRLQKIVYVDRQKDLIRFLHDRNVYVAPLLHDDTVGLVSNRCCPAYVCPEVIHRESKRYRAQPADIWSLGVLLYVLLTGRYPFYEEKPKMLARRIRLCQFAFKSSDSISRSARLLVHCLLRLNPLERPSAELVAASDWLRNSAAADLTTTTSIAAAATAATNNSAAKRVVRIFVPANVHLNAAVPLPVPVPLLHVLLQPVAARNSAYASQPEIAHSMEAFVASLERREMSTSIERQNAVPAAVSDEQVVPVASATSHDAECDAIGLVVKRVPATGARAQIYRD